MMLRFSLLTALIFLLPILASASAADYDLLLQGNEIDLLVGAPTGVVEPLDTRRTRMPEEKKVDYSGFLEEDFQSDASLADIGWIDAEDQPVDEGMTEEQYLDLVNETEEIEKTEEDDAAKTDANSTDSVETEFKL